MPDIHISNLAKPPPHAFIYLSTPPAGRMTRRTSGRLVQVGLISNKFRKPSFLLSVLYRVDSAKDRLEDMDISLQKSAAKSGPTLRAIS